MQRLHISKKIDSPEIILDLEERVFTFTGNSYPSNSETVYEPVLDWFHKLEDEVVAPLDLTLNFKFNHINSSSYKNVMNLLFYLNNLHPSKLNLDIVWNCPENDPEMFELGGAILDRVNIPNVIIKVKD